AREPPALPARPSRRARIAVGACDLPARIALGESGERVPPGRRLGRDLRRDHEDPRTEGRRGGDDAAPGRRRIRRAPPRRSRGRGAAGDGRGEAERDARLYERVQLLVETGAPREERKG